MSVKCMTERAGAVDAAAWWYGNLFFAGVRRWRRMNDYKAKMPVMRTANAWAKRCEERGSKWYQARWSAASRR